MKKYIAILRGINVSGQKLIKMHLLRKLFEEIGFKDVVTYIQSGNVIFTTDEIEIPLLEQTIEQELFEKLRLNVPVIVRSAEHMEKTVANNPFLYVNSTDYSKLHVTFLSEIPDSACVEQVQNIDFTPDRFIISGLEVYLYCPGGYGTTKLSNSFFENKLKVKATTRNWNTVVKLNELLSF